MNAALAQPESAPRRRWLIWAAVIFAAQAGFIFWLGAKHPIAARPPHSLPPIALADSYNAELAALRDPTLFALPHRHGFSGSAWAFMPRSEFVAADWDEPLRTLPLPAEKLGASFRQLLVDARTAPLPVAEKIEPQTAALDLAAGPAWLPTNSTLRVEGALTLASPPELPSWPAADVLAASEVRVLVDAAGRVMSAVLLKSCGLNDADQKALELARAAQFQPPAGLSLGRMILQWHTVAPASETLPTP